MDVDVDVDVADASAVRPIRLSSYRDVAHAFAPPSRTATRQASYDQVPTLHECLVTLDGEAHRRRRQLESPLFTAAAARRYERDLFPELARRAFDAFAAAEEHDLVRIAIAVHVQFAARLTGLTAWETVEESLELYDRVVPIFSAAANRHSIADNPGDTIAEGVQAMQAFEATHVRPALDARRAIRDAGGELAAEDVMSVLIAAEHSRPELGDDLLLRESILFITASAFTSPPTVVHAFDELHTWLTHHPEDGDRTGDRDFLQQIVHETIRLHPATHSQFRHIVEDVELPSGRVLRAGQQVVLDMAAANRDPAVWGDDPDAFRPGREHPAGVAPYGLSFGGGPHTCIGRLLAAGSSPRHGIRNEERLLGSITSTLGAALEWGARPDPDRAPRKNETTLRDEYVSYPIVRVAVDHVAPAW